MFHVACLALAILHAQVQHAPQTFTYDPAVAQAIQTHEPVCGDFARQVYAYATFETPGANPAPYANGVAQGVQTLTLGEWHDGTFKPAVRIGLNNDGRAPEGQGHLAAWAEDGASTQFSVHARASTPYDFKVVLDVAAQRVTIAFMGRGDTDWCVLSENAPLLSQVAKINHVRVELNPGAVPVRSVVVQDSPWPEGESIRPHPLAKGDRVVAPNAGFRFQAMRTIWRTPGRHVTISRNPGRWMGFPDVVQTDATSLACCYADGAGHGGGGSLLARLSHDLGETWSDAITVLDKSVDAPRIQRLNDGTLLTVADVYDVGPLDTVLFDSQDGGKSWINKRFCHAREAGGNLAVVPSHVVELADGSWLMAASWYPGGKAWEGDKGECIEIYRSTDRGTTWSFYSRLEPAPPHSLSEPSILILPDGRLLMYAREGWGGLPGIKAYSNDLGKTWACQELPFPIVGRTCANFLDDGRVMMTFRAQVGRAAVWAWVGEANDDTPCQIWGAHYNDATSVGLKDGALHIDNDGRCGQFTQYFFRSPDGPDDRIDLTAEVEVVRTAMCAATLSVPFVGKLRIFRDHVELAHDPSIKASFEPGRAHTYHLVAQGARLTLDIDGQPALDTDKVDGRTARVPWTPVTASSYAFAFGNERDDDPQDTRQLLSSSTEIYPHQISARVNGYSIWRRVRAELTHPSGAKHVTEWSAADGHFPDQYQLDHIIEIDASATGHDQGYSGWCQIEDASGAKTDRLFITAYTDDTAPVCPATQGGSAMGVGWIRGTFLTKADLPAR